MAFFKNFIEIVEEGRDSGLDLYIEREHSPTGGPRSSFRWAKRLKLAAFRKQETPQHNFNHRILVSKVIFGACGAISIRSI
ncbi:hypothetical protein MA16_Dca001940 [Dendrobium catenatum]|uniref:Uncharacterized protein n=1 Tax=Dendrobium catenatum TaxID=906689 RepID=A0A2I0XDY1_9ASPA|nr:hypothetical protein MA16_Dca001940 [Dendrobium catenatum]